jgi:hypothetical protein
MKLTAERLREVLSYDPNSGLFVWKVKKSRAIAGSVAGTNHVKGYIVISVDGNIYLAHRLAWLYVHGVWPDESIDHRDCNRSNNIMSNLRLATFSENNRNQPIRRNNTSGQKCVHWSKSSNKWQVRIWGDGKRIYLGSFVSQQEANEAYKKAVIEIHGEFANFGGQS